MSDTPVFIMNDGRYVKEEHFDRVEKQLAEALADADHWKSECNTLQRIVHEARAEIENLQWRVSNEKAKAEAALELNDRALELVNEARAEIARKDKLIDLLKCCATCERQRDVFCPDSCKRNPIRIDRAKLPDKWTPGTKEIKAALAAEGGE